MKKILLIEDNPYFLKTLAGLLKDQYKVYQETTGNGGLAQLQKKEIHLVVLDMLLPDLDGLDVLRQIKSQNPLLPVMVFSGIGEVPRVVEAMKSGADTYVIKKSLSDEELLLTVQKTLETAQVKEELSHRQVLEQGAMAKYQLIGKSKVMANIQKTIERVASRDCPVLLLGETGTGKEVVARLIHLKSPRRDKPFVALNCAAMAKELIESELFGHVGGSFTGAQPRKGKFLLAHGGTLLLDEVGDLPLDMQVKLLRALEEGAFYPVGSENLREVDVRILSATNRDLDEMMENGTFRRDLYHRLELISISIPPLRERREDIPLLIDHFLQRFNQKFQNKFHSLTATALKALCQAPWKGNVRELKNLMERIYLLYDGEEINLHHLPKFEKMSPPTLAPSSSLALPPAGIQLEELEGQWIRQALERTNWNRTESAKLLGLSYKTFLHRMKKHGLESSPHLGNSSPNGA